MLDEFMSSSNGTSDGNVFDEIKRKVSGFVAEETSYQGATLPRYLF